MTDEDKAAKRTGYGCLAMIFLPVAILLAVFVLNEWRSNKALQRDGQLATQVQKPELPPTGHHDPFTADTIVYSHWPSGNVLGDNRDIIPCSTNYDDAYALMLRESDTKYELAVSAGKRLLDQDYTPESEIKQAFIDYILEKHKQQQLLFMSLKVKMQIIQKVQEGDISHARIYQCRILEPGSEGMVVYIQSNFITTQPPELRQ